MNMALISLKELLPMARKKGTGRQAHRETAARLAEMGPIPGAPEDAIALALGFTPAHEEVDTTNVETRHPEPMVSDIALVEHVLPLAEAVVEELHHRFEREVKR
jgi:Fe2+ transport system protein FeoA